MLTLMGPAEILDIMRNKGVSLTDLIARLHELVMSMKMPSKPLATLLSNLADAECVALHAFAACGC
jgi:hypothetical protein